MPFFLPAALNDFRRNFYYSLTNHSLVVLALSLAKPLTFLGAGVCVANPRIRAKYFDMALNSIDEELDDAIRNTVSFALYYGVERTISKWLFPPPAAAVIPPVPAPVVLAAPPVQVPAGVVGAFPFDDAFPLNVERDRRRMGG